MPELLAGLGRRETLSRTDEAQVVIAFDIVDGSGPL